MTEERAKEIWPKAVIINVILVLVTVIGLIATGCGDQDSTPGASETVQSKTTFEAAFKECLGDDHGISVQVVPVTEVEGYGSQTDFYLIICADGYTQKIEEN